MTTKAPLCIGTMMRDLPSRVSARFTGAEPSAHARAGAARQRSSSATAARLLLIGATSTHDTKLHLVRGLEVVHVNAREVAGVRVLTPRGLLTLGGLRVPLPPIVSPRQLLAPGLEAGGGLNTPATFLLHVDRARHHALLHDRHLDDAHGRRPRLRLSRRRLGA